MTHRTHSLTRLSSTFCALSLFSCDVAVAQAVQAEGEDAPRSMPNEIIVTAQRRAEGVLSVPISIDAFTGEGLQAVGLTDITSLRFNTPGFSTVSGTGYTQIFIRGIGNRIPVGSDASVSTFIDDVPRIFPALVDDLYNVDRVEVLKGAQGGLYGRNATGGVVNIITRQPTRELIAESRVSYGSFDTFEASGFLNLPITDGVAANVTVTRRSHDDYTPNRAIANPYQTYAALSPAQAAAYGDTGQRAFLAANPGIAQALDAGTEVSHMNNLDRWIADGKLALSGEGFKITLAGDYSQNSDAGGNGWQNMPTPDGQTATYGTYAFLLGSPVSFNLPLAVLPFSYVYPADRLNSKYDLFASIRHYSLQKDYGASAKADIEMPGFTLTSISALRWSHSQFRGDLGAANIPTAGFLTNHRRRNFYQEIRLVSDGTGPFRWLAGANYYRDTVSWLTGNIVLGNELSPTTSQTRTEAYSAYAQGEVDIAERLKVIGSLRYVAERKTGDYPAQAVSIYDPATQAIVPNVQVPAASGSSRVKRLLPAITISLELPSGGNAYARWARGLKSGGINPQVHPAQTAGSINVFEPEQVDTFELGLRTRLLDRLQLTSALFYNRYRDLQISKPGYTGLPYVLFNAGKARTYGAEASLAWQVSDVLNLSANVGYLNAQYVEFSSPGIPALAVAPFDVSGNRMVQSPKWQGGASITIDAPITDRLNVVGSALWSYSSRFFSDDTNAASTSQRAYSLVNLRAGVKTNDHRLGAYISVRNLFNKYYQAYGYLSALSANVMPGDRRIVMGTVEFKFR